MKVGGNESATTYFRSHGGSAALASKDPTIKYTSSAATKYKEELKRRVVLDAKQYPDEVAITDSVATPTEGSSTPSGEQEDDFFSSWDKPSLAKSTPPMSRSATPPIAGRAASPFLKAPFTGNTERPKSPLAGAESSSAPPPATRTTSSAVLRKTTTGINGPRKTGILGAKKTTKLGTKKIDAPIDFEAAEKKAREEEERISKLGYDPNVEDTVNKEILTNPSSQPTLASPTPVYPTRGGFIPTSGGSTGAEKVTQNFTRLGFGMTAAPPKPASAAPARLGFGAVGASKAAATADDDFDRARFSTNKAISSDEFFGKGDFDPAQAAAAKSRSKEFEGSSGISSNAYFGRPEDEEGPEGGYGDLESTARDLIRKFGNQAGDDLEGLSTVVGAGANKLQGERFWRVVFLRSVANCYSSRHYQELSAELIQYRSDSFLSTFNVNQMLLPHARHR